MTAGALLLRGPFDANRPLRSVLAKLADRHLGAFDRAVAHRSLDGEWLSLYLWTDDPAALTEAWRDGAKAESRLEAVRLAPSRQIEGASAGSAVGCHYVVEIEVDPADADALRDWYEHEHLAGLAAVDGAVTCRRMINLDAEPRSYACYDLMSAEVLQSAPWLAVRATDWATRVRPLFKRTRRTLFERLLTWAPGDPA